VLLEEAGQLAELLMLLGHLADARLLQQQLSAWAARHQEALARLAAQRAADEALRQVQGGEQQQQQRQQQQQQRRQQQQGAAGAAAAPAPGMPNWKWDILRPVA
jgi:hypothetical protein